MVSGFHWRDETGSRLGHIALVGESGPVALFGFYNWVQLLEGGRLLVWHQATRRDEPQSSPVSFALFDPAALAPLDLESAHERIEAGEPRVLGGDPEVAFCLPTDVIGLPLPAKIPLPLDELLLWCHSSGAGELSGVPGGDTALMVVEPRSDSYALHAQAWFNKPSTDFGYQWLTRVARQRLTGRVMGDGIRVGRFVLDRSLRQRSR